MIEEFKTAMGNAPIDKFIDTISKGALKLSKEEIETVQFVFWFVYMAEIDLNSILVESWKMSSEIMNDATASELAKRMLKEMIFGKQEYLETLEQVTDGLPPVKQEKILNIVREQYTRKREIDIESPEYFIDKIRIYQAMFGKNDRAKLLWKLNDIRNHIGHNRIGALLYDGESLFDRKVKEKMLADYFESSQSTAMDSSDFWNTLSPEEQKEIRSKYEKFIGN